MTTSSEPTDAYAYRSDAGWLTDDVTTPDALRALIESFAQAYWETNADGRVVADSSSWRAYTGQTLDEWLGEGWVGAVRPDDQAYALRQWQEAVSQQTPVNAEFRLRSPDGGWRWTNVRAVAVRDADGAVRKWVGLNVDVTERKRAQQEVRSTNDLLQTMFDSSLEYFQLFKAVRNERGDIVDFEWRLTNKRWTDQWGEVAGKRLLTENPAVIETGLFEKFKQVTESGVPDTQEHHYVHEQFDGWFFQTVTKVEDGFLLSTLDITERKRVEETLRQSEEKYRTLFESIDEGFCIQELRYDDSGKLVDLRTTEANPACERQTGFTKDVIGRWHSEFGLTTDSFWFDIYDRIAKTGEPETVEHWHELSGRWYHASVSRIGEAGSRQLAVVFNDITERKQREQQQAFLLKLSDALRPLKDPVEIQQAAMKLLTEELDVMRATYIEVDDEQETYELTARYETDAPPIPTRGRITDFSAAQAADYRSGRTLIIRETEHEAQPEAYRAIGIRAALAVPLVKDGRLVSIVGVHSKGPRDWTAVQVQLLEELAERTWAAVERAKAEEALHQQEERLRIVVEAAELSTWEWNLDTDEVFWNEQHFRLFGMEPRPGPLTSDAFAEHVHPDDRAPVMAELERTIREKTIYNTEFRAVRDDGAEVWMSGYGRITDERAGQPTWLSGVMYDITERKRREINAAFLADLGEDFARLTSSGEIMQAVGEKLSAYYGLTRLVFAHVDEEADLVRIIHDAHEPGLPSALGEHRLSVFATPGNLADFRAGKLLAIRNVATDSRTKDKADAFRAFGATALLMAPFVSEGQWRFVIVAQKAEPYAWRPDQLQLLDDVVPRLYLALERRRFQALRQLTLLQQTEDLANVGSWEFDRATGRFNWSAGMYRLFEMEPGRPIQPETYLDYAVADDRNEAQRLVAFLQAGEGNFENVMRIRTAAGDKTVRINASVIGEGAQRRVLGVDLDITEQLLAQQQIQETAENLQAVLDGSPAAIGLLKAVRASADADRTDPQQIVDFQLAVGNVKLAEFFDQPLDELLGQSAERFSTLLWAGKTINILRSVWQRNESLYQEQQLPDDGRWLALAVSRQDDGALLTALDITELKEIQSRQQQWVGELEQTRQSADALGELRDSLSHRSELLRAVSHDLRGNFGVISGAVQLLGMAASDAERAQMLDMVLRNVKQATELLTELLDYTRLESGQEGRSVGPMDVAPLLRELTQSLQPVADEQHLLLHVAGPEPLPVEGDRLHVHRMAQNLIINALKYTHAGSVTVMWGINANEGRWWFSVEDTGPGLGTELVARLNAVGPAPGESAPGGSAVGEPGNRNAKQLSRTDRLAGPGSSWTQIRGEGIGLRIVRQLATLLEARLRVTSAAGVGTRFVVSFPLRYE